MSIRFPGLPKTGFDLSLTAAKYRSSDQQAFFTELNARISMLHPDLLALLYHLAANLSGPVLELGPYIGGSTVALARGLRDAGSRSRVTSIEIGGSYTHPDYGTDDIVRDLRLNLSRYEVAERVNLIVGHSRTEATVAAVRREVDLAGPFRCLFIDTDGQIDADLALFRPMLEPRSWLVVDDYYAPGAPEKEATTRPQLDRLTESGTVEALGIYGWGTWIGRLT